MSPLNPTFRTILIQPQRKHNRFGLLNFNFNYYILILEIAITTKTHKSAELKTNSEFDFSFFFFHLLILEQVEFQKQFIICFDSEQFRIMFSILMRFNVIHNRVLLLITRDHRGFLVSFQNHFKVQAASLLCFSLVCKGFNRKA